MIRTAVVALTLLKAVAYRQKLKDGGSGITIIRQDMKQPGIASISKTSGKAIPAVNIPQDLFPEEAFEEAMKLTAGMPYSKRGGITRDEYPAAEPAPEPVEEEAAEEEIVIDSAEYQKIVAKYTDKDGKLSYELLDRDMIRFAHSSKTVHAMLEDGASVKKIRTYVVVNKFRTVTGNKKLTEAQALRMAELLDEVSPRSVFKVLDAELRKMSAAYKNK